MQQNGQRTGNKAKGQKQLNANEGRTRFPQQ